MSELRRLQVLLDLQRYGTIAAVAEATAYSTSGISQQLAALERDIGVPLVAPDGRRIKLTPAGLAVAGHASAVLAAWEETRAAAMEAAAGVAGVVRLGAFQTACLTLAPALLDALAVSHPGVDVSIIQAEPDEAVAGLLSRDLDAAIVERYPGGRGAMRAGLLAEPLGEDPMVLALPEMWAGADRRDDAERPERPEAPQTPASPWRTAADFAGLANAAWALERPGSPARAWADELCRGAGFSPTVRFETDDVLMQLEPVRQGRAVALLPGLVPARYLDGVAIVPLTGQSRTLEFVRRTSGAHDPLVDAVRAAITLPQPAG